MYKINLVADSISASVSSKLESPYKMLATLAENAGDKKFTRKQIEAMISNGIKNDHIFESIYIINNDREITYINLDQFASYDPNDFVGIKVSDINKSNLKIEWSRPHLSAISNKNVVTLSIKFDGGHVVGNISLDSIRDAMVNTLPDKDANIFIADASGDIIASNIANSSAFNLADHPLMGIRKTGHHIKYGYVSGREVYVGAIHKINASDWYLIYEQPVKSALFFYRQILFVTIFSIVLLAVFSGLILYFIRIKLILPMKLLTERSEMISKGTFLHFNEAEKGVFRELRTLYDSFEKMAITIDRREKELKDKEEYLRSIFDSTTNTGLIIISLDSEPVILDANTGTQLIFGYKLPEILGLPVAGLIKGLADDITLMCSESRYSGSMVTKRIDMIKKNGVTFPALCTISPQFNYSGKIQGFIGVVMDITEITKVQSELEGEKERLDVTLKSIGEGVIAADKYGRITLINSSAETILGQKYRFLLGHSISEVVQVYDYDTGKPITDRVIDFSENTNKTFRANMVTKDAGVITVYITSSAMFGSRGDMIGSVYVFRDITERMKMEQELINRKKQLEEINKGLEKRIQDETHKRRKNEQMLFEQAKFAAMGQMINAIAHQWRQPLNALALYVQDIEDAHDAGEVNRPYLDNFIMNAMRLINHMSGTIDDFRNFFHSGNTMEQIDIADVVFESMSLVATQLRNQHINYKISITDGTTEISCENKVPEEYTPINDKKISVYPSELKQVILNILQNARYAISDYRKSTGNNKIGNVNIQIQYKQDRLKLDIANDGGNIPEETLSRIFDPYFSTKPEGEGTGIGLYMSKIMIEDHMNGLLIAENISGGAMFSITLSYFHE
ncbi:MAG: PAS domain S-box protein [Deferribacterales bacterium]